MSIARGSAAKKLGTYPPRESIFSLIRLPPCEVAFPRAGQTGVEFHVVFGMLTKFREFWTPPSRSE